MLDVQPLVLDRKRASHGTVFLHQPVDVGTDGARSQAAFVPDEDSLVSTHAECSDGELQLFIQPFEQAPRAPGRLTLQVDEDALRVVVEPILDEPVEHAARFDCENKLRVRLDELDLLFLDVVRDRIPRIPDAIPAVEPLALTGSRDFLQRHVSHYARPPPPRAPLEGLPEALR